MIITGVRVLLYNFLIKRRLACKRNLNAKFLNYEYSTKLLRQPNVNIFFLSGRKKTKNNNKICNAFFNSQVKMLQFINVNKVCLKYFYTSHDL